MAIAPSTPPDHQFHTQRPRLSARQVSRTLDSEEPLPVITDGTAQISIRSCETAEPRRRMRAPVSRAHPAAPTAGGTSLGSSCTQEEARSARHQHLVDPTMDRGGLAFLVKRKAIFEQ